MKSFEFYPKLDNSQLIRDNVKEFTISVNIPFIKHGTRKKSSIFTVTIILDDLLEITLKCLLIHYSRENSLNISKFNNIYIF